MDTIDALGNARLVVDSVGRLEWDGGQAEGVARLVQLTSGQILLQFRSSDPYDAPNPWSQLNFIGVTPGGEKRILKTTGKFVFSSSGIALYGWSESDGETLRYIDLLMLCGGATLTADRLPDNQDLTSPPVRAKALIANFFSDETESIAVANSINVRCEPTLLTSHPMKDSSTRREAWGNFETHELFVQTEEIGADLRGVILAVCAALRLKTGQSVDFYQLDLDLTSGDHLTELRTPGLRPRANAPVSIDVDVKEVASNLYTEVGVLETCVTFIDRFVDACDGGANIVTRGLIAATLIDDVVPQGPKSSSAWKAASKQVRRAAMDAALESGLGPFEQKLLRTSAKSLLRWSREAILQRAA